MPTQQIEFEAPSGMTLTAKLYTSGSDTVAYTASAVTEQTNRKGVYQATFSNVAANTYQLIATVGTNAVAVWWGYAQNSNATYQFGSNLSGVWDELMSSHTINGSYGSHLVRSQNQNQNTVQITGSNHIAADVHAFQTDVIDSAALATSAVSEINAAILTLLGGASVTVNAPVSGGNYRIDIIRGDTYNDIRKPKLRFTVAKNYTGCTITLTIRHRTSDAVLLTKNGTVDSATLLSVELTGTDTAFSTLPLDEYGLHVFDLQATDGSSNRETIIVGGSAVLLLDQSR